MQNAKVGLGGNWDVGNLERKKYFESSDVETVEFH